MKIVIPEEIYCKFIEDLGEELAIKGKKIILDQPVSVLAGCPRDARSLPHWQLTKISNRLEAILYCEIEDFYSLGISLGSDCFLGHDIRPNLKQQFKRLL